MLCTQMKCMPSCHTYDKDQDNFADIFLRIRKCPKWGDTKKNEVFMLACEPLSNISNIVMQLWRRRTRFKKMSLVKKGWLWWWWERIHTKGARAVPRWSPWQPHTPFPCSDASSSPFSASSPTRQTRLRTSEIMLTQNAKLTGDHLTRKLSTSYKQSDRQSWNLW